MMSLVVICTLESYVMGLYFCLVYCEVGRWTYASVVADAFAYYGLESELAFVEHGDVGR
jgi:hypothetical protein